MTTRKLKMGPTDPNPPVQKIVLWEVLGYDPYNQMIIVRDNLKGERHGIWTSTGAMVKVEPLEFQNWSRDDGPQRLVPTARYEHVVPPPIPGEVNHDESCRCVRCQKWHKAKAIQKEWDERERDG